jgi:hypothetical protein
MAWIVHGRALARVSPQISLAAGAGLVLAPTSAGSGFGTSSRSVERSATDAPPTAQPSHSEDGAFAMGSCPSFCAQCNGDGRRPQSSTKPYLLWLLIGGVTALDANAQPDHCGVDCNDKRGCKVLGSPKAKMGDAQQP